MNGVKLTWHRAQESGFCALWRWPGDTAAIVTDKKPTRTSSARMARKD